MEKIILNVVSSLREKEIWCAYGYDNSDYYLLIKLNSKENVISFIKANYPDLKLVVYPRNYGPMKNLVKVLIYKR